MRNILSEKREYNLNNGCIICLNCKIFKHKNILRIKCIKNMLNQGRIKSYFFSSILKYNKICSVYDPLEKMNQEEKEFLLTWIEEEIENHKFLMDERKGKNERNKR